MKVTEEQYRMATRALSTYQNDCKHSWTTKSGFYDPNEDEPMAPCHSRKYWVRKCSKCGKYKRTEDVKTARRWTNTG